MHHRIRCGKSILHFTSRPQVWLIGVMVALVMATVVSVIFPKQGQAAVALNTESTFVLPDLSDGHVLSISFLCQQDKVNSISLLAATYMQKHEQGEIRFVLSDQNQILRQGVVPASNIMDNRPVAFCFQPVDLSGDTILTLSVITQGVPAAGQLTFWANNIKSDLIETTYDAQSLDMNVILQYGYLIDIYPYTYDLVLFFVFTAVLLVVALHGEMPVDQIKRTEKGEAHNETDL